MSLTALLPSLDPALVTIICAIFLFAGVVKGFLGIGLPAAAMGLLTLVIPPTEAIHQLYLVRRAAGRQHLPDIAVHQ